MFTIEVDGARISCTEAGEGELVVLLHCTGGSGAQWGKLAAGLEGRWRVLALDLFGYGASDPWPGRGPLTLAEEAAVVQALAVRCGGPVHLVGHSYGGAVALRFALDHPELLSSLTLIEPAAFHLLRERGSADRALFRDIYRVADGIWQAGASGAYERRLAAFVDFWSGPGTWAGSKPESQQALARCLGAVALNFWSTLTDSMQLEDCAALRVPTLILSGDRSPAVACRITQALAGAIPGAEHRVIEGAGHMLPLSHREPVQTAIAEHLARAGSPKPDQRLWVASSGGTAGRRARTGRIALRRLTLADLPEVEAHLLALGPADRNDRFHALLGDEAIAAYVRRIDFDRAILIGAIDQLTGAFLGLAEAHLDHARSSPIAEMSVSVSAGARRRGIGRVLVRAALDAAFASGAEQAEFFFLPENRALARLVHGLGASLDPAAGFASLRRRRSLAA